MAVCLGDILAINSLWSGVVGKISARDVSSLSSVGSIVIGLPSWNRLRLLAEFTLVISFLGQVTSV